MKRFYFLLLLALASCESVDSPKIVIGVSQCSDDQWRDRMNNEMLTEALFYDNVEVRIQTAYDDSKKQISDIKKFVQDGVDLLVVMPNEAAPITSVVENAYDSGIPVIVVDRKILSDSYTSFVGADNYQIGKDAGDYIVKTIGTDCKVIEFTGLGGSSPAIERHMGFLSAISSKTNVDVLASEDALWLKDEAFRRMSILLDKHPDIDVVFAHNDRMAQGAYEAAKEVGRENDILFLGVDALPGKDGGIELVNNGVLFATFIYPTGGDTVIKVAMSILEGKPYARDNILSSSIVDKTNSRVTELQTEQIVEHENKIQRLNNQLERYSMRVATQQKFLYISLVFVCLILALATFLFFLLRSKNRMNKDLVRQRDKVMELSEQVEAATAAKLLFFTNISHEFKTPLTLISDPLDTLIKKKDITEEDRTQLLTLTKNNVSILLRLINQILDFRKLENGKMSMKYEDIDVLELIKNCNRAFSAALKNKHLSFDFNWDDGENYCVSTDGEKLSCIYCNLISNALKYTPVGGAVDVSLMIGSGMISFSIHNTGSFIKKDDLEHIFDRFYRVDKDSTGSGIGLSIVKAYTQLLGGNVSANSSLNEGTTFSFEIPMLAPTGENVASVDSLVPEVPDDAFGESASGINESSYNSNGRYLLVIDDNKGICDYLCYLFKDSFKVLTASNGRDGLNKAIKFIPDIIISDVLMPGDMDGMKCCSLIKENPLTCHIPVILLTALSMDEQKAEGYQSGADSYLTKPFNSETLISRVNNLLQGRERLREMTDTSAHAKQVDGVIDMDKEYIEKLRLFIEGHMDNSDLSVDDICKHMASSRTQLFRKVKMLTGWTPAEFLRILRLNRAKEMLKTTSFTSAEIGYKTGFSSPSYFAKCYKDFFGISPTSERQ